MLGEGGGGFHSIVSPCRINVTAVSVHEESNRNKSPPASLAGYKAAVTQALRISLFITAFSQHAFESKERGHHVFHRLINVRRYEPLLTKHRLQVQNSSVLVCSFSVFPEQICL